MDSKQAMDRIHLERALALACESVSESGGPFGAVIVRGEEVLAEGTNRVTSSHDPTAHAEVVAVRAACLKIADHRLLGCTIYCSCEPCPLCLSAIHWARMDRIVFAATRLDAAHAGFDDELLYREIGAPPAERVVPAFHEAHADAVRPFVVWATAEAKILY